MTPAMHQTARGHWLAYHQRPGNGPGVVFLGGFRSDMEGTKALHLDAWALRTGRGFLRFDYGGHGQSEGAFTDGTIGAWADDAAEIVMALTDGPQILVGSSMGGWIALLLARRIPERVAGLVTIAAAPDFTEDSMWAGFDAGQRKALLSDGQVALPSDYDDGDYVITRALIDDGRHHLLLRDPLPLPGPARFLHGTADQDVTLSTALRLLEQADGPDTRLTLVDGADHRFSSPECLAMIEQAIADVTERVAA